MAAIEVENTSQPASQLDQAIACFLAGAELLPARRLHKRCRASMNSCAPIFEHEDEGKNVSVPALPAEGKPEAEPIANSQVAQFTVVADAPSVQLPQLKGQPQQPHRRSASESAATLPRNRRSHIRTHSVDFTNDITSNACLPQPQKGSGTACRAC